MARGVRMGYKPIGDEAIYTPANLIPNTSFEELTEEEVKRLKAEYANTDTQ